MALAFAVVHLYHSLKKKNNNCFCPFLFYTLFFIYFFFFLNLVLINRRNGPRYQRALALCASLIGAILKGLILRTFCVRRLCMFCNMQIWVSIDFAVFRKLWFDDLCEELIEDRLKFVLALMWSFVADWAQNTN